VIGPKNTKVKEMFQKADDVLFDAVRGVTDLITKPGFINADFADVRTVMSCQGMALMGEGRASGENRALDAAKSAITSPLLEDVTVSGCKALLVNITANDEFGVDEFNEAASYIEEAARGPNGESPEIVLAMAIDPSAGDEIRITVIATGIEPGKKIPPILPPKDERRAGGFKDQDPVSIPTGAAPRPQHDVNDILRRIDARQNTSFTDSGRAGVTAMDGRYDTPSFARQSGDMSDLHSQAFAGAQKDSAESTFMIQEEEDIPAYLRR
ncbi:MAG: cell division protein FtsZ, partial [Mailhella sp.]|nr:cell division protein FtsZ [Mailhella sp.]